MEKTLKRYEELIYRLDKSELWLQSSGIKSWEEVKQIMPQEYQLRCNLIMQIEAIQKIIHKELGLKYGG